MTATQEVQTVSLHEWVPALAQELDIPAEIVHMKARRYSIQAGIPWALEMPVDDVAVLRESARKGCLVVLASIDPSKK